MQGTYARNRAPESYSTKFRLFMTACKPSLGKVILAERRATTRFKIVSPDLLENLQTLFSKIANTDDGEGFSGRDVELAAAALLIHCARADGHRSEVEDRKLREILRTDYELAGSDADDIVERATADEAAAIDVHSFTRILHKNLDRTGRLQVVRQLWEVAHADSKIDHEERSLVSLVASLMDVEVADAVALRRNVTGNS